MTFDLPGAPEEIAARRSRIYWLLAGILLATPDDASRAAWRAIAVEDRSNDNELAAALRAFVAALDAADPAALAVEHTRLFGGLSPAYGPPPPLESAHRGGGADTALTVTHAYREAGYADIDTAAGADDHLAVELKFMALLALREHEAEHSRDAHEARAARAAQQRFLDAHLLAWLPDYARLVERDAREPTFIAALRLIDLAVRQDRAFLDEIDA